MKFIYSFRCNRAHRFIYHAETASVSMGTEKVAPSLTSLNYTDLKVLEGQFNPDFFSDLHVFSKTDQKKIFDDGKDGQDMLVQAAMEVTMKEGTKKFMTVSQTGDVFEYNTGTHRYEHKPDLRVEEGRLDYTNEVKERLARHQQKDRARLSFLNLEIDVEHNKDTIATLPKKALALLTQSFDEKYIVSAKVFEKTSNFDIPYRENGVTGVKKLHVKDVLEVELYDGTRLFLAVRADNKKLYQYEPGLHAYTEAYTVELVNGALRYADPRMNTGVASSSFERADDLVSYRRRSALIDDQKSRIETDTVATWINVEPGENLWATAAALYSNIMPMDEAQAKARKAFPPNEVAKGPLYVWLEKRILPKSFGTSGGEMMVDHRLHATTDTPDVASAKMRESREKQQVRAWNLAAKFDVPEEKRYLFQQAVETMHTDFGLDLCEGFQKYYDYIENNLSVIKDSSYGNLYKNIKNIIAGQMLKAGESVRKIWDKNDGKFENQQWSLNDRFVDDLSDIKKLLQTVQWYTNEQQYSSYRPSFADVDDAFDYAGDARTVYKKRFDDMMNMRRVLFKERLIDGTIPMGDGASTWTDFFRFQNGGSLLIGDKSDANIGGKFDKGLLAYVPPQPTQSQILNGQLNPEISTQKSAPALALAEQTKDLDVTFLSEEDQKIEAKAMMGYMLAILPQLFTDLVGAPIDAMDLFSKKDMNLTTAKKMFPQLVHEDFDMEKKWFDYAGAGAGLVGTAVTLGMAGSKISKSPKILKALGKLSRIPAKTFDEALKSLNPKYAEKLKPFLRGLKNFEAKAIKRLDDALALADEGRVVDDWKAAGIIARGGDIPPTEKIRRITKNNQKFVDRLMPDEKTFFAITEADGPIVATKKVQQKLLDMGYDIASDGRKLPDGDVGKNLDKSVTYESLQAWRKGGDLSSLDVAEIVTKFPPQLKAFFRLSESDNAAAVTQKIANQLLEMGYLDEAVELRHMQGAKMPPKLQKALRHLLTDRAELVQDVNRFKRWQKNGDIAKIAKMAEDSVLSPELQKSFDEDASMIDEVIEIMAGTKASVSPEEAKALDDVIGALQHEKNLLRLGLSNTELSDSARKLKFKAAAEAMGEPIDEKMLDALVNAHNEAGEFRNLTKAQQKARIKIMRDSGMSDKLIRLAMDGGFVGIFNFTKRQTSRFYHWNIKGLSNGFKQIKKDWQIKVIDDFLKIDSKETDTMVQKAEKITNLGWDSKSREVSAEIAGLAADYKNLERFFGLDMQDTAKFMSFDIAKVELTEASNLSLKSAIKNFNEFDFDKPKPENLQKLKNQVLEKLTSDSLSEIKSLVGGFFDFKKAEKAQEFLTLLSKRSDLKNNIELLSNTNKINKLLSDAPKTNGHYSKDQMDMLNNIVDKLKGEDNKKKWEALAEYSLEKLREEAGKAQIRFEEKKGNYEKFLETYESVQFKPSAYKNIDSFGNALMNSGPYREMKGAEDAYLRLQKNILAKEREIFVKNLDNNTSVSPEFLRGQIAQRLIDLRDVLRTTNQGRVSAYFDTGLETLRYRRKRVYARMIFSTLVLGGGGTGAISILNETADAVMDPIELAQGKALLRTRDDGELVFDATIMQALGASVPIVNKLISEYEVVEADESDYKELAKQLPQAIGRMDAASFAMLAHSDAITGIQHIKEFFTGKIDHSAYIQAMSAEHVAKRFRQDIYYTGDPFYKKYGESKAITVDAYNALSNDEQEKYIKTMVLSAENYASLPGGEFKNSFKKREAFQPWMTEALSLPTVRELAESDEMVPVRDESGEILLDENGKTRQQSLFSALVRVAQLDDIGDDPKEGRSRLYEGVIYKVKTKHPFIRKLDYESVKHVGIETLDVLICSLDPSTAEELSIADIKNITPLQWDAITAIGGHVDGFSIGNEDKRSAAYDYHVEAFYNAENEADRERHYQCQLFLRKYTGDKSITGEFLGKNLKRATPGALEYIAQKIGEGYDWTEDKVITVADFIDEYLIDTTGRLIEGKKLESMNDVEQRFRNSFVFKRDEKFNTKLTPTEKYEELVDYIALLKVYKQFQADGEKNTEKKAFSFAPIPAYYAYKVDSDGGYDLVKVPMKKGENGYEKPKRYETVDELIEEQTKLLKDIKSVGVITEDELKASQAEGGETSEAIDDEIDTQETIVATDTQEKAIRAWYKVAVEQGDETKLIPKHPKTIVAENSDGTLNNKADLGKLKTYGDLREHYEALAQKCGINLNQ